MQFSTSTRAARRAPAARSLFAATALFLFVFAAQNASAATFTVNTTADTLDAAAGNSICADASGLCSLRAAISEANALAGDDIITLPAGTYTQTLVGADNANASGDFDITSGITINGAGSGNTFIEAATTSGTAIERVIHLPAAAAATTVVINDVTLRNGRQTGGSFAAGLRVENNYNATLNRVVVRDNQNNFSGGGIYATGAATVLTLNGCQVVNNAVNATTAGFGASGGGIFAQTNPTVNINNSTVNGNSAASSGASTANALGGGISFSSGTFNINNSAVNNNTITSSVATTLGGGIGQTGGTLNIINNSTVNNNIANATGTVSGIAGGIYNHQATLTITNSTVSGNSAASFHGGVRTVASATAATTTITGSAIVNNTAPQEGGGIISISGGAASVTTNISNSTVGGNTSPAGSTGGIETFVTAAGNSIININFSTIAGNSAAFDAGGISNFGNFTAGATGVTTVNLQNSVVANNFLSGGGSGNEEIFGVITSLGYNLIENPTGGTFTPTTGDQTGVDPMLGALGVNRGTTPNYLPQAGSVLIDAIPSGTNGCGTAPFNFDQRRVPRPVDSDTNGTAACEKGSVEVFNAPTAGEITIGGRVLTDTGRGIRGVRVMLTDASGTVRTATTSAFGRYRFTDVAAGETYVLTAKSARYTFSEPSQVLNASEDTDEINFIANPTRGR